MLARKAGWLGEASRQSVKPASRRGIRDRYALAARREAILQAPATVLIADLDSGKE